MLHLKQTFFYPMVLNAQFIDVLKHDVVVSYRTKQPVEINNSPHDLLNSCYSAVLLSLLSE
jgi:hypothetical protein